MKSLRALVKRLARRDGLPQRIVLALACALVLVMYWTNDDNAGKPDAVRGQGRYLPVLARGDGHMMYLIAQSTALDLDWRFDNNLAAFGDPWLQPVSPTGRKEIPHPIGPPLVWTPLIWIAHAGAAVANVFGADIPMHGYTEWHQRFVFLSCVAAALLAMFLARRLAVQLALGRWAPTYGAILVLLGTSLTYYTTYMPSYGHALDAGACAAFLAYWALTLGRLDWRRWVVLGVLLGVAMLIRMQDVGLGVVVSVEVVTRGVEILRRRDVGWERVLLRWTLGGASVLGVALVVFSPQFYFWHVIYGDWWSMPQGSHYTRLGSPMILELLYAPRNGWFSTTPIAYLGTLGLFCLPRRAWLVGGGLFAALAVQVYLSSAILDWWGMSAWGQRRLCSVSLVLVVGLAALLWRMGRLAGRLRRVPRVTWHVVAVAILAPMMMWNVWRVHDLAGGKGAPAELDPTCCAKLPRRFARPLTWIYMRIGNPFEFPANAYFALKHGVEIQRWDHAVGYYALMPSAQSLRSDAMYNERGSWRIGYPGSEPYLKGHWSGPKQQEDRWFRWTVSPTVTALVPILMPLPQRFTLQVAPGGAHEITVRWDGDVVARKTLGDAWEDVVFDVHDMAVGEHELTIDATPAPFPAREGWPVPTLLVGVAIGRLEVELIRPTK
jgi:hypothetical protein